MLKGRASEGRSLGRHSSAMLSSEARDRLAPGGVYTCCSLPIPIWTCSANSLVRQDFGPGSLLSAQSSSRTY